MARGPPDPEHWFELVTSGVSGRKPKLEPAAAEGSVKELSPPGPPNGLEMLGWFRTLKKLGSELCRDPFPELPGLCHRQIPVVVGHASKNIAAKRAVTSIRGRDQSRAAHRVTAEVRKRC